MGALQTSDTELDKTRMSFAMDTAKIVKEAAV
jgi:hypothetical protein